MFHYVIHISTTYEVLDTIVLHIENHDLPRPLLPELKFTKELIDQTAPVLFVAIITTSPLSFLQYQVGSVLHAA